MRCDTTLTEPNHKEIASKLSTFIPRDRKRLITQLKCISCDLETFPNEMLNSEFKWEELDFSNGHIKHLKMNALDFTVSRNLRRLNFNNNSITYLDYESFPTSEAIKFLDLSHNLINRVTGSGTFSKMPKLEVLNLANNYIEHLDSMVFKELKYLEILKLNNNRLVEVSFICQLSSSMVIMLSSNPIVRLGSNMDKETYPTSNCSIRYVHSLVLVNGNLETIDLSYAFEQNLKLVNLASNQLTYFELKKPVWLEVLDLSNNKLQGIKIGISSALKIVNLARNNITNTLNISLPGTVEELNLSHNKIVNLAPDTFENLIKLRYLNLAHCGLQTINAEAVLPTSLTHLDLSHNRFVTMDMNQFNGFNELEILYLNGNRLTDIINVEDLKLTTQLKIENNDWNCTRLEVIVDILKTRNGIIFSKPCDPVKCDGNVHGIACRINGSATDLHAIEASNENSNFNLSMSYSFRNISESVERLRLIADGKLIEVFNRTDVTKLDEDSPLEEPNGSINTAVISIGTLLLVALAIFIIYVIINKRADLHCSARYNRSSSEEH